MDGVLGNVSTKDIPKSRHVTPKLEGNKNAVHAAELKPKQTIRFEFGIPGNWIMLKIERICSFDKQIILFGKNNGYQDDYSFEPDEMLEVVK